MADDFTYDVVVRLATQGLKSAKGEVEGFGTAMDELVRTGKVSEKTAEQASRAITQQGRASKAAATDTKQMTGSVNALRYANYDLGRSLLTISAGITAVGVGVVAAAGSFESSFTAVERTSGAVGDAVGELRGELVALTREIPQSFGEIANIGARGAQLGIASDQLADFTEVVAKFVATSDSVSLDQAVESLGRISNLTGERDFNALGSAISMVGVNAAATEAQIVKTTQELAPFAASAGVATADVIGLAAAVSSLGQPPERARSAFLTLQRVVDGAVNGMNDNLGAFASLLGMTEEQTASLWKQDPGAFIQAFSSALGSVDNLTVAFDQLGINERRAVQVFQALAADSANAGEGMSVLDRALQDSNQGFEEGTELQRQYALILDDLSSKWQIFLNSIQEAAAAVGTNLLPAVKSVLDVLTGFVQGFADFAATDIGGVIIGITTAVAGMVAAYTAVRGAIALATGAALAFNFVTTATGGAGIVAGLRGLASAFGLVGASATVAATGTHVLPSIFSSVTATAGSAGGALSFLRVALTRLLAATGIGALLVLIGGALTDLRGTALTAIDAIQWLADTFGAANSPLGIAVSLLYGVAGAANFLAGSTQTAGQTLGRVFEFIGSIFGELGNFVRDTVGMFGEWAQGVVGWVISVYDNLGPVFQGIIASVSAFVQGFVSTFKPVLDLFGAFGEGFAEGQEAFGQGFNDLLSGARDWATTLPSMTGETDKFSNASYGAADASDDFADGLGNVGGGAADAAQEVRTLVDYANDLQSVFSRSFDIRFAGGSTLDDIRTTFIGIKEATDEAVRNIRGLKAEIQGLQSDLSIQQYFLGIALEYDDAARAEAIQANIAKIQADLAGKTADLSDEQDKNSKTLTGNSKAAIANRDTIEGLVEQYQAHLTALAASGLSQTELARKSQQLRAEFVQQATSLGYSRVEVERYAVAFDDMTIAINNVPRNVTVRANVNPAIQALNELQAKARSVNRTLNSVGGGLGGSLGKGANQLKYRAEYALALARSAVFSLQAAFAGNPIQGLAYQASAIAWRVTANRYRSLGGFAEGGYTGAGGKYQAAGIVHRGEYVVPKKDVNQRTGLPYADAMGRLQRGASGPGYANGGYVRGTSGNSNPSGQIASFGPMAYQQLHQALQQIVLLDGQKVATNSADHYAQSTAQGAY